MYTAAAWLAADQVHTGHGSVAQTALPSAAEGFFYGAALPSTSHAAGLQSGGMLGYSTFFTGYDPDQHGMGRRVSAGRAGLQVISTAARALSNTPLQHVKGVGDWLERLSYADKYGIAGVVGSQRIDPQMGQLDLFDTSDAPNVKSKFRKEVAKWGLGAGGGAGWTDEGKAAYDLVNEKGTNLHFLQGKKGSVGATVFEGKLGKIAGLGLKGAGILQIGMMAAETGGRFMGRAYGQAARVATRIQRAHDPRTMSHAYFSDAASTERRRAVMELQSSALNPRTQLMGNEASMVHHG